MLHSKLNVVLTVVGLLWISQQQVRLTQGSSSASNITCYACPSKNDTTHACVHENPSNTVECSPSSGCAAYHLEFGDLTIPQTGARKGCAEDPVLRKALDCFKTKMEIPFDQHPGKCVVTDIGVDHFPLMQECTPEVYVNHGAHFLRVCTCHENLCNEQSNLTESENIVRLPPLSELLTDSANERTPPPPPPPGIESSAISAHWRSKLGGVMNVIIGITTVVVARCL